MIYRCCDNFQCSSIACYIRTIVGAITEESHYELTFSTELSIVHLNDIEKLEILMLRTYFNVSNYLVSDVRVSYNVFIKDNEIKE